MDPEVKIRKGLASNLQSTDSEYKQPSSSETVIDSHPESYFNWLDQAFQIVGDVVNRANPDGTLSTAPHASPDEIKESKQKTIDEENDNSSLNQEAVEASTLTDHVNKVSKNAYKKPAKEAAIIRLMARDEVYPTTNWRTDELRDNISVTQQIIRTYEGCHATSALLFNSINLKYVRLLKRRYTPKNTHTTPYHFPIPPSIDDVNTKMTHIYTDLKAWDGNIDAAAKGYLSTINGKTKIKRNKGERTVTLNEDVKKTDEEKLATGLAYCHDIFATATRIIAYNIKGTYPSYPHSYYRPTSYQLLYAIAFTNYLYKYHLRKDITIKVADSLYNETITRSGKTISQYDISTFHAIGRSRYQKKVEAQEGSEGEYYAMEPGYKMTNDGIKYPSSGSKTKSSKSSGIHLPPKSTNVHQMPFNVKHAQYRTDDVRIKGLRIRDHKKGNVHLVIGPTRGTKVMLWTNINTFLYFHGWNARRGLAMIFKMDLLPKEMLKQIVIASMETGALYRLSANAKNGMELIPFNKYPTVASMPDQVYNKYAMFIDRNSITTDSDREISLDTIDKTFLYNNSCTDNGFLDEKSKWSQNQTTNSTQQWQHEIMESDYNGSKKESRRDYDNKIKKMLSHAGNVLKKTRDNLLGTTSRQRIYVHEQMAKTIPIRKITTITEHFNGDEWYVKIYNTKVHDFKMGYYIFQEKIPEISNVKLLEGLPLSTHPRDIWWLNMDTLIYGVYKIPLNHIRIADGLILYKDQYKSEPSITKDTDPKLYGDLSKLHQHYKQYQPNIFVTVGEAIQAMQLKGLKYIGSKYYLQGARFNSDGKLMKEVGSVSKRMMTGAAPQWAEQDLDQDGYFSQVTTDDSIVRMRNTHSAPKTYRPETVFDMRKELDDLSSGLKKGTSTKKAEVKEKKNVEEVEDEEKEENVESIGSPASGRTAATSMKPEGGGSKKSTGIVFKDTDNVYKVSEAMSDIIQYEKAYFIFRYSKTNKKPQLVHIKYNPEKQQIVNTDSTIITDDFVKSKEGQKYNLAFMFLKSKLATWYNAYSAMQLTQDKDDQPLEETVPKKDCQLDTFFWPYKYYIPTGETEDMYKTPL